MTMDKDALMFANILPGQPGYFYTMEDGAECIRLIVRDGTGNLWIDRGRGGEPLERAVDDVLDIVPTREAHLTLHSEVERLKGELSNQECDTAFWKTRCENAKQDVKLLMMMDQCMWCSHCRKMLPCRYRPSPDAGPYWRCSECGKVVSLKYFHTWQQERAAVVAWLRSQMVHTAFTGMLVESANLIEAGEHWTEGGTP